MTSLQCIWRSQGCVLHRFIPYRTLPLALPLPLSSHFLCLIALSFFFFVSFTYKTLFLVILLLTVFLPFVGGVLFYRIAKSVFTKTSVSSVDNLFGIRQVLCVCTSVYNTYAWVVGWSGCASVQPHFFFRTRVCECQSTIVIRGYSFYKNQGLRKLHAPPPPPPPPALIGLPIEQSVYLHAWNQKEKRKWLFLVLIVHENPWLVLCLFFPWFNLCSVIDTDARPGPRNLIDNSLMTESDATSNTSVDSASFQPPTADPIAGFDVHEPDSDMEEDGLLEEPDMWVWDVLHLWSAKRLSQQETRKE